MYFPAERKKAAAITAVSLLMIIAAGFLCCYRHHMRRAAARERQTLERFCREHREAYLTENRRLLKEFQRSLPAAAKNNFVPAEKAADALCREMTSLKFCAALCWDYALNIACGSDAPFQRFQHIYSEKLLPQVAAAERDTVELYRDFCHRVRENDNRFRAGIADLATDEDGEGKHGSTRAVADGLSAFSGEISGFAVNKLLVFGGAALEVVFAKSTADAARKLCYHIALKWSQTAAAGAVCAVADGPLPIGDAVGAALGIGGAAVTAFDLWQVSQVLPMECKFLIQKILAQHRQELTAALEAAASESVRKRERESALIIDRILEDSER